MPIRVLCLVLLAGLVASPPRAEAQIATTRVASGLLFPVFATAPAGDAERLFIVEQRGVIKILKNGSVLPTPFLNIDALITNPTVSDERGLLGLTFSPDYGTSGHFYVYYTDLSGDSNIVRYTVSANPDSADPASALRILFLDQPFSNHNGGTIEFGPDGYLYMGFGDGGDANDPFGYGQDPTVLLGKMIRIDPTGDDFPGDALQNYAIPPSNPFVGNPAVRDEIWALGLRNPYRWSFDRLTGDRYVADVGQGCWEEVSFEPAGSPGGLNFGWKRLEGNHCFQQFAGCTPTGCDSTGVTLPIREYSHSQDGFSCSISGGFVYRGAAIPQLAGTYFYADYCSAQIYSFRYDGSVLTELTNRTSELAPGGGFSITSVSGFGQDGVGELYIVDRAATAGEIYKIVPDPDFVGVHPEPANPIGFALSRPAPNPFGATTRFDLAVPQAGHVRVSIHDAAGRLVRSLWEGETPAGVRAFTWDGRDAADRPAASGVYFVRAIGAGKSATQRIALRR